MIVMPSSRIARHLRIVRDGVEVEDCAWFDTANNTAIVFEPESSKTGAPYRTCHGGEACWSCSYPRIIVGPHLATKSVQATVVLKPNAPWWAKAWHALHVRDL